MAVAAAVVVAVAALAVIALEHGKSKVTVTPISAAPDAYAASLPITRLAMSESANLAGALDGSQVAATGDDLQLRLRDQQMHLLAQAERK